jgi:hypothetical protein
MRNESNAIGRTFLHSFDVLKKKAVSSKKDDAVTLQCFKQECRVFRTDTTRGTTELECDEMHAGPCHHYGIHA